jgi:hypothetical protein
MFLAIKLLSTREIGVAELGLDAGTRSIARARARVPRRVKGRGKRRDPDHAEAVMAIETLEQSNLTAVHWKTRANLAKCDELSPSRKIGQTRCSDCEDLKYFC